MDRSTLQTASRRIARVAVWLGLTFVSLVLARAGEAVGLPSPQLVIATAVGAVTAALSKAEPAAPKGQTRACHALIGVLMASYLHPETFDHAASVTMASLIATVTTIGLCALIALLLARVSTVATLDAVLGLAPGGSASIIASAAELGADRWQVAVAQYLRVALVALTAPLLVLAAAPDTRAPTAAAPSYRLPDLAPFVQRPDGAAPLLVLAAVCVLGSQLGSKLRLPAPALLGSAVLTMVVVFTETSAGFAPAGLLRDTALVMTGLEVGFHFSRARLRRTFAVLPYLLAAIISVCAACGGIAWVFSAATGVGIIDAYLATTPGGITAVLAVTASAGSDMTVISTAQCLRLFVVAMAIPLAMRCVKHWRSTSRRSARASSAHGRPTSGSSSP
ncbi:AbrB family transcriptional regulator [Lentzea sp. NPDC059081]|uniref:AbrB family transcriptional regulator n=1 Tax=Lentzea sp. NPDC059081 TaxID=3346719 RepID=UPI0036B9E3E4